MKLEFFFHLFYLILLGRALMKKTVSLFLCFLFPAISILIPSLEASSPSEMFKPLKVDKPPVIDGKLDEPVWAAAPYVTENPDLSSRRFYR